ncbi:MAG: hypothetical protein LBE13_21185 [Bacteroidales bacterium]|jgi:hypothetical protein|nr:hypothetical protein [Bacteroidales bacterium]
MELASKKVTIQALDRTIYNLLINCNNIAKYIPNDKIQNWQSTEDYCSFSIEGAGKIEMNIQEKIPYSTVSYSIGNALTKGALIVFSIKKTEGNENLCELQANANLEIPFFMAQMIKSSLQRFMDMLVEYIKVAAEKNND